MQVKKQQLELDMEQRTGSKLGKEYVKAVYCHTAYLTHAEYIMWNARLDEAQTEIKIAGRNINNLRYADATLHSTISPWQVQLRCSTITQANGLYSSW